MTFFFVTRYYQSYRGTSDRDRGMGISTTSTSTQNARRRERRPENDEDTDGAEDRERYRSRPRRRSTELDPQQNLSSSHSPPKPAPRHRSLPSAPSPFSDSASSPQPVITESVSNSSPRRNPGCDLGRDGPDQHTPGSDEPRMQRSPPRGEYHPGGAQVPGLSRARSSSFESVEEWDEDPSPQPPPLPVQKPANLSMASGSTSQLAPSAGSCMLTDSELADETVHLRALLGCPPGAPVGLDALADPPPGEKPNYPLPTLIKLAIYGSPRRRLTLQEIYQALEDRFEWFRQRTDKLSWKVRVQRFLFCLVGFWRKDRDRVLELHSAQSVPPEVLLESPTAHHGTGQGQLLDDRPHAGGGQQTREEAQQETDKGSTRRTSCCRGVPCICAVTWSR